MAYLSDVLRRAKQESPKMVAPVEEAVPQEELSTASEDKTLVDSYGEVRIFKRKDEQLLYYEVPAPRYRGEEKQLVDAILELAANNINLNEALFQTKAQKRIKLFHDVTELLENTPELKLPANARKFYANAVVREMEGFGLIDPLVADDALEEIMVIGVNRPVYVFHRKYDMMKTNIMFYDDKDIRDLIDRIARTIGRRIDIQTPLMDARLPDGTRVNATIPPISLDGSTLTLRKFREDPLSILDLIANNTLNTHVAAFLWLAVDGLGAYPANTLIAGGTASGKCMTGDTPVVLADGSVKNIKDVVEGAFASTKTFTDNDGWDFAFGDGTSVLSLDQHTLKLGPARIEKVWRHKTPAKLVRVKTRTGREITVTPEHPFFTLQGDQIVKHRADELAPKNRIAVPKEYPLTCSPGTNPVDLLPKLYSQDLYIVNENTVMAQACQAIKTKLNCKSTKELAAALGVRERTLRSWIEHSIAIPLAKFIDVLNLSKTKFTGEDLLLKSKTSGETLTISRYLTPELMRLAGLIIADGHLDRKYVEFHNQRKELLEDAVQLFKTQMGIEAEIQNYPGQTVPRVRAYSSAATRVLHKLFGVPIGVKSGSIRLPEFVFTLSNEFIAELLSGMYDCDSHFAIQNSCGQSQASAEYSTKSGMFAGQLPFLLLRFGVLSHQIKSRFGHHRVIFYGRKNFIKFAQAVNLRNENKKAVLQSVQGAGNEFDQIDLYPGMGSAFLRARNESGLTQAEVARRTGLSRRIIGLYENNQRAPTRGSLQKLVSTLRLSPLQKFVEGHVFFDEITEVVILENHGEQFVYDFTIENNHTFVAGSNGGLVAHNTTTLNAISSFVPNHERLVSIEDTSEIRLPFEHWIRFEARPPGIEGSGEVDMNTLLKNALRMRPDRIIVGEIRGEEGYTLFNAMNTGHKGSLGTVHSNSARETLVRLASPPMNVPSIMLSALNFVVMQQRTYDRRKGLIRRVTEVAEIQATENSEPSIQLLFQWNAAKDALVSTETPPAFFRTLSDFSGLSKNAILEEWQARTDFLTELAAKGVREINETTQAFNSYAHQRIARR